MKLEEKVRILCEQPATLAGTMDQFLELSSEQTGQEYDVADVTPAEPPALPTDILTLDDAARVAGLTPESLLNRIYASGGKRIWAQCGRLPVKTPLYDREKFLQWLKSPANLSPARDGKRRKG